jgi:hypothetical protein
MKHLIILTLLMLIAGLSFTVLRWRGGLHMTFSQHAATNRSSKIFYFLLFLISLPTLLLFFSAWYVPTNNLPTSFLWFASVSVFFQVICNIFPEEGGTKTLIHRILTGISGIALLPMVIIIATSSHFSEFVRGLALVLLIGMVILLGIALRNQKGYRYALPLQIGYYTAFFITILVSTYV